MAQVVLGAIGSAIGGGVGRTIGALLGGHIDRLAVASLQPPRQIGPRLEGLKIQGSAEGAPMAFALGRARLTGHVIWAARFRESRHEHGGGKGGPRTVEHAYSLSFAVALCEGPVDGIGRIWADGQPMPLDGATLRLHRGGPDQTPDPLIEAIESAAPAYRGLAYAVFEDLPLGPFGNRVPQLSFEVFRRPRGSAPRLEDRLDGVCLIPGAGEFTLATRAVLRREGLTRTRSENVNNLEGRPDLLVSLDQLQAQCPNVRRVNLVVGWFGDDLRASHCRVRPGVDQVQKTTTPMDWSVASLSRDEAHLVSQVDSGPAFGGTPSDETVRQAIAELKARGFEVTIYPFVFMDIPTGNSLPDPYGAAEQPAYPWRGRITGSDLSAAATDEVAAFFGGPDEWGLRRMARHYAALAAETGAAGLLIGSELRGLTTLRDAGGGYPAVAALRTLAGECKAIVGTQTAVSYAADWSEYFGHQPADGSGDVVFHLDPLWADPAIACVGIDWYPPLSDWRDGKDHADALAGYRRPDDPAYLAANVAGGEGFDWYYASASDRAAQVRTAITDGTHGEEWVFRPKDLIGWWSNAHHDRPGGVRAAVPTAWAPAMKSIRLFEIGCGAIDRGANAPNLFQDPKSAETAIPPFSDGARDDLMQRRTLEALLEHFAGSQANPVSPAYGGSMLAGLDAWCWDARPFPDFPARPNIWSDAGNWATGHWLNGRMAGEGEDLIRAVLLRSGVDEEAFSISGVDRAVAGYVIDGPMRVRDALEPLLSALDASAAERGGRIGIVGRPDAARLIGCDTLAIADDDPPRRDARRLEPAPDAVRVRFIDDTADYQIGAVVVRADRANGGGGIDADLPAVCSAATAETVARRILAGAAATDSLSIQPGPLDLLRLEPGDMVTMADAPEAWRVERIDLDDQPRAGLAPWRDAPPPGFDQGWRPGRPPDIVAAPWFHVLDLPPLPEAENDGRPLVALAADPWRAMDVHAGAGPDSLTVRGHVATPSTVGQLLEPLDAGPAHRWDRSARVVLRLEGRAPQSAPAQAVLGGANTIAVACAGGGWELIQFLQADPLDTDVWRLTGLLRGQQGTDEEMRAGAVAGAAMVLLNDSLERATVAPGERGSPLVWRAGPAGAPPGGDGATELEFVHRGLHARPWSPAHFRAVKLAEGHVLRWIPRARMDGDRWDGDPPQSDPVRFRIQVVENGGGLLRSWEVEGCETLYPTAEAAADFPDGPGPYAEFRVAQWSALFGWGSSASLPVQA